MADTKLQSALGNLEKARVAALEAAVADGIYRACGALDAEGPVQRGVNKARKALEGRTVAKSEKKK
jgi:hypothetical protein